MVSQKAQWILARVWKADPLAVAIHTGDTEQDCWEYLIDLNSACREAEDNYTKPDVTQWVQSIPDGKETRRKVLLERLEESKTNPQKYDVPRLLNEVKLYTGKLESLTQLDIETAKEHSLHEILNTQGRRGNVSCPFHKDKTPSFQIKKNNTFTCYSCGIYGDSIDLYQKLNNCTFAEAVNNLK